MKIRVAEAIKDIEGLYKKGTIFTEYCDNAGMFYPDTIGEEEIVGIDIELEEITKSRGGFNRFFRWLSPIDAKHTVWYRKQLSVWKQMKKDNEETINDLQVENIKLDILLKA